MKKNDVTMPRRKGEVAQTVPAVMPVGFLTVTAGKQPGQVFAIKLGKTIIGRADNVDITLDDSQISRQQLAIEARGGGRPRDDADPADGRSPQGRPVVERGLDHRGAGR